ncbi:hypothetical protein ACU686_37915 [Yinghuangia aomiensis]
MLIGEPSRPDGRPDPPTPLLREPGPPANPHRGRHSGYREYTDEAVLTVHQTPQAPGGRPSPPTTSRTLLPCVTGPTPEMAPCQEIVDSPSRPFGHPRRPLEHAGRLTRIPSPPTTSATEQRLYPTCLTPRTDPPSPITRHP